MFAAAAVEFMLVPRIGGAVSQFPLSIEDARERFAEAWSRLASDTVSYIAVVMVVLASTTSLVVVTLLPRYSTHVLGINAENAIFIVTPAAVGIWLALRFVAAVAGRLHGVVDDGRARSARSSPASCCCRSSGHLGRSRRSIRSGCSTPDRSARSRARMVITGVIAAGLAFAYTFLNIVGRSVVNQRIPQEMQGRVFAAQTVLTNLASIPPILLAGLLADALGVTSVFFFVACACAAAGAVLHRA